MPLYMDLHILPGIKAKDVAEAHRRDMLIQEGHACKCMTYWIDEKRGNVFCLIEAPDKEAVEIMHSKAHGLIPNKIIEVDASLIESFLGRINDPDESATFNEGLKIFSDTAFRVLVVIKMDDPVLLKHNLGLEKANSLLKQCNAIIRNNLTKFGGSEIENEGHNFIASFVSANNAASCALAIQETLIAIGRQAIGFKIAIHAGEPVTKNDRLFGDTMQLAERMCMVAKKFQVIISSAVKEFIYKDYFSGTGVIGKKNYSILTPNDEELLCLLFNKLEENLQDTDFTIADYCFSIAISKSKLYRKIIALSGFSPNILLKEFRLQKAVALMKQQRHTISEITFNSGFSSPSYFTKCFKKKFGITPMAYLSLAY